MCEDLSEGSKRQGQCSIDLESAEGSREIARQSCMKGQSERISGDEHVTKVFNKRVLQRCRQS